MSWGRRKERAGKAKGEKGENSRRREEDLRRRKGGPGRKEGKIGWGRRALTNAKVTLDFFSRFLSRGVNYT